MDTPDKLDNQEDLPTPEVDEGPRANYESLAQFVISILILVIVISGTLNILLLRLWKSSQTDVQNLRPQFQNIATLYQKNEAPAIERITKTFQAFGATNPDYVPILTKWGFASAATSAPATSAPAPSQPKK